MIWWAGELHLQKNISKKTPKKHLWCSVSVSRCLCFTHVFSCPSLWRETFVRCDRQVSITRLSQSDHSPSPSHPWDSPSLRAGTHSGTAVGRPAGGATTWRSTSEQARFQFTEPSMLSHCCVSLRQGSFFISLEEIFFPPSRALLVARLVNYCSSNFQLKWKKRKENR